jgi:4-amino-4-deoxy-L-arabinose transferase-like glycosyltransferase
MVDLRDAWRDPSLWTAATVGLILRLAPWALWGMSDCIRDECIYRTIAQKITEGEGLTTAQKGWLPAPGYPYLLAWSKMLTGSMQSVKGLQVFLAVASIFVIYGIAREVLDRRTARITAWLFAIHPTLVFFSTTMWIETIYIFLLLVAILGALVARRFQPAVGAGTGVVLGLAILFRGIATYLPPVFALGIVWPEHPWSAAAWRESIRARWKPAIAMLVATVLTVAPWSLYASPRQGGFLVSDATVGHVMWLGNNDYPPLTFDYGIGMLTEDLFAKYLRTGRRPCDRTEPPVVSSRCDVQASVQWIRENPGEFVRRIPMRCAQFFNPNSFLTRHVRWGYWGGIPWWFKELVAIGQVVCTAAIVLGGTVGILARGRGAYAWIATFIAAYTLFASAIMYGMTRFRLPIEPLWLVYLAAVLAAPRETWALLREQPVRLAVAIFACGLLTWLMAWYLPTGFPMFW